MQKIISLFARNHTTDHLVRDEIVPEAAWVRDGEGVATEKLDGTCCLVRNHLLFKRYEVRQGKDPPLSFEAAQEPDPLTGHQPGWVEVGDGPDDQWHREAWTVAGGDLADGTYELLGPKVQGNPYQLARHVFHRHGSWQHLDVPRDYEHLFRWLVDQPGVEGLVWWQNPDDPNCAKVKVKRKDLGLIWPPFLR